MNLTKPRTNLKNIKWPRATKRRPATREVAESPTFHYTYKIIQTNVASGDLKAKTDQEAKAQVRELIAVNEGIIFDSNSIQIVLTPICFSCQKEHRKEDLMPYGMCSVCYPPELIPENFEEM